MADNQITIVGVDGTKFTADDTLANRRLASARGYRVDESILRTVGESARGAESAYPDWTMAIPTTWVPRLLMKGVGAAAGAPSDEELEAQYRKEKANTPDQIMVRGPDGQSFLAADTKENRQLAQQRGYSVLSPTEQRVIEDPTLMGARGAVKTYVANAQNEYLFGLPAMAADRGLLPEGTFSPALQDKNLRQALEKENPTAEKLGMVAGTVANLLTPGLNMGGAAGKGARLGEAVLARAGVKLAEEGAGLGTRVLVGAAQEAGRGLAYASPRAAGALVINEDPIAAGEILLAGVGIGALLGGGGQVAKTVLTRGAQATTAAAEKFVESSGGIEAANARVREKVVDTVSDKLIGSGLKLAGVAKGGPAGYVAAEAAQSVIGPTVKRVVGRVYDDPRVQKIVTTLAREVGQGIQKLPEVLPQIGEKGAPPLESASINAVGRLLGKSDDTKLSPQDRYRKVSSEVTRLATDPNLLSQRIGQVTAGLEGLDPRAVQQFSTQATNAVDYIFSTLPKVPAAQPFGPKLPWEADSNEMRALSRRLDAAIDPVGTIRNELRRGTLSKEHVETLERLYPKLTEEMRSQVLRLAAEGKSPELKRNQREQVALFLGGQLERSTAPAKVQAYQDVYAQRAGEEQTPTKPQARASRLGRLESQKLPTVMTTAQAQAARNSRT